MEVDVVVEVPAGRRNKYEFDTDTGALWLSRRLLTAARCPVDYGYVDGTKGPDGDPLDGLVVLDEPAVPGCRVRCRPIAVLWITLGDHEEAKVLCVPVWDEERGWNDQADIPSTLRREIGQFFEVYKDIEPSSSPGVSRWEGRRAAERVVRRARRGDGG